MGYEYTLVYFVPIPLYKVPSKSSRILPLQSGRVEWCLCADGDMNYLPFIGINWCKFRPTATFRRPA